MDAYDYLRILRRYWVSVAAIVVGTAGAAMAISLLMTPVYTASTAVFLAVQSGGTAGELNQGSTYAENQVRSYAQVATAPLVLQPVIDDLGLQVDVTELAQRVTATAPTNTAIIEVEVTGTNPAETAAIANAVGTQLIAVVDELSPQGSDGARSVKATTIAPALVPTDPTSPRVALNLAIGLVLGLLLGFGQAVLRSRLDTRVVSEDDVAQVSDHSVVGAIAFDAEAATHPLIFDADPHSVRAEAYRRLRTNLQFLGLNDSESSIVLTSSVAGEGKTTTSINVASTLADAGQSVLLIDADLRRPKVATYLNLDGTVGLTTVVIGRASLQDAVQPIGHGGLHVLASGQVPPNPSELLGSQPMAKLLAEATERYDVVIIDAPPLLPVTDAAVLSRICGGVLVVASSGTVTRPQLGTALESLERVEANVLGVVLNKVKSEAGRYGYKRYDAYYQQEAPHGRLNADESIAGGNRPAMPLSPVEQIDANA